MLYTDDQLRHRSAHHPAGTDDVAHQHTEIRDAVTALLLTINRVVPEGEHKAYAIKAVEEAGMWANRQISLG